MKKVLSIALALVMMLGLSVSAQAQQRILKGVVTAAEDGLPMPGVTVLDKTNQTGTTTNVDGEYSIAVGSNSVVIFSFIGYATQEVTVGNQSEVNITLSEDTSELSEVVVTAFGLVWTKHKSL
ncbi:carboxypeptidase-like regulatory domain-containing protein [Algoriphagus antarcticus]|uniref:Carboxypeptidase-like protein n=1 Tax=Algoriphagus antarcticus TaxID=238540 RepID=A0A3E0DUN0_9BACT|nr:carboxypeptidase-like regulatory domain-containing protein [Algoriphagus antarcticus]REG88298.1 carboxypeptidase-like protein [Algoriphagus antarcticus]